MAIMARSMKVFLSIRKPHAKWFASIFQVRNDRAIEDALSKLCRVESAWHLLRLRSCHTQSTVHPRALGEPQRDGVLRMIENVLFPWPHFVVVLELSRHAESGQFNAPAVEKHLEMVQAAIPRPSASRCWLTGV